MVYDWSDKKDICRRMYLDENKSLEQIMVFMRENHNFTPSKRAYQTQFKRWEFESKQRPAHKNEALVNRVKELWEANEKQADMLRILNKQGFNIKERELMRLRSKYRWLLRIPNGMRSSDDGNAIIESPQQQQQLPQAFYTNDPEQSRDGSEAGLKVEHPLSPEPSAEVIAQRQERLGRRKFESDEKMAHRKRRRRTRGWAGLPADPPGPPRFPSETTLDESKQILHLTSQMYIDLRNHFTTLCQNAGVIKKTTCGPTRWEELKTALITEVPHLHTFFWGDDRENPDPRVALDVICTDVTKRMRTQDQRMTIAVAKNALSLNPEEAREIRGGFYRTLKSDHFTSKLEAGEEHWQELKQQWINESPLLQSRLTDGDIALKNKALEVLCRDVMKRLRDDQNKRDPHRKKKSGTHIVGTGFDSSPTGEHLPEFDSTAPDNLADFNVGPDEALVQATAQSLTLPLDGRSHNHGLGPEHTHPHTGSQLMSTHPDMQIDPDLLVANNSALMGQNPHGQFAQQQFSEQQYADQEYAAQAAQTQSFVSASNAVAVYFRLSPQSNVEPHTRLWVATLSLLTVDEIRQIALMKYPYATDIRIAGIVKENVSEMAITIDEDDELHAYLSGIGGVKPTFSLTITL